MFRSYRYIALSTLAISVLTSVFLNRAIGNVPAMVSYAHFPEKTVLLTFDDGPARSTATVLNILRDEQVKGLFFLVGENITPGRKALMQRMVDEGHMLGNHGYHHVNMTKISSKEQVDALKKTNTCIACFQPKVHYFRPPGGSRNDALKRSVTSLDMQIMMWNIDPQDWKKNADGQRPNQEMLIKRVLDGLKGSGQKGIILLHDIHETTANHLRALIDTLKKKGFKFLDPQKIQDYQKPALSTRNE